jgi:hypothetical protein
VVRPRSSLIATHHVHYDKYHHATAGGTRTLQCLQATPSPLDSGVNHGYSADTRRKDEPHILEIWGALHMFGKVQGPVSIKLASMEYLDPQLQFQSCFVELEDVHYNSIQLTTHNGDPVFPIGNDQCQSILPLPPMAGNKEYPLHISFQATPWHVQKEILRRKIQELGLLKGVDYETNAAQSLLSFF